MKIRALLLFAILATITAAFASCGGSGKDLAATVNGVKITIAEVDENVVSMKNQFAAQGQAVPDEEMPEFRENVLENLIRNQLLTDYAKEKGYKIDRVDVDAEISGIASQFDSNDAFKAVLEQQGFTEKSLREEIEKGMVIERMLDGEVLSKIEITADDVAEFYGANPQYFARPESVSARHILVMAAPDDPEEDKKKALAKIQAIRAEIAGGADFAAVAREKSEGPSAPDGGSLGTFGRGQMVPPFEAVAFALEPGVLSDIVQTDFGYHIILVDEKIPAGMASMAESEPDIIQYLSREREQGDVGKFIEDLRAIAKIEIFESVTAEAETAE